LVTGPRWAPDAKTDWPTDCRSQINFRFRFRFRYISLRRSLITRKKNMTYVRKALRKIENLVVSLKGLGYKIN
jgi:hypothetical protein